MQNRGQVYILTLGSTSPLADVAVQARRLPRWGLRRQQVVQSRSTFHSEISLLSELLAHPRLPPLFHQGRRASGGFAGC